MEEVVARSGLPWTPAASEEAKVKGRGTGIDVVDATPIDELFAAAAAAPNGRALLSAATNAAASYLGGRGSCVLLDDRGARVVYATAAPDLMSLRLDLTRYPEMNAAVQERAVVCIEDVRTDPRLNDVRDLLPQRLGAVIAAPMIAGGSPLGILLVQFTEAIHLDERARRTFGMCARLAALLFEARFRAEDASLAPQPVPSAARSGNPRPFLRRLTPIRPIETAVVEPQRLLIAEDDPDQAATLSLALGEEGYIVKTVANGHDAVENARTWRPDLIVLDVSMPVLDGFAAAEELVKDSRTRHVPLLFLSAADNLLPRLRGLSLDEIDFLRKPYDLNELFARIERSLREAKARANLRLKANVDELTGVGNFRYLREQIAIEQSRLERYGTPIALVVADVDKLKTINDVHGHVVGSEVLRGIGAALRGEIRDTDLAARYGGDEFVIVLPHAGQDEGLAFANRLLARINHVRVGEVTASVSLGVAAFGPPRVVSFEQMLAQADAAAYRAKRAGGNRICAYDPALDG